MNIKKSLLKVVRITDKTVDFLLLSAVVLLAVMAAGSILGTDQMYEAAMAEQYTVYRPEKKTGGYDELKKINSEVIGWVNLYGTGIDYPLVQGKDNDKYVETDPMGEYSMTGSLFLDCRNRSDFSDFNSIIYGHDMAKEAMFGGLSKYRKDSYFKKHLYGTLYHDGKKYGIEVFAYFSSDAYDRRIYTPGLTEKEKRIEYLQLIKEKSKQYRDIEVTEDDHIVLFSTCTDEMTNGRNLLALKITDKVRSNPYRETGNKTSIRQIRPKVKYKYHVSLKQWIALLTVLVILVLTAAGYTAKKKGGKKR